MKLIQKIKINYKVLSSNYKIVTKCRLCYQTLCIYLRLTFDVIHTHNIMSHVYSIIEYTLFPIQQSSEEAAENGDIHFRSYWQNLSRKLLHKDCI